MGLFSQVRHISQSRWATATFTAISLCCMGELLTKHVYDWATLSGPSMYLTLPSHGIPAFINRRCRFGRNCKVGDIIEFSNPTFPGQRSAKRILGMPGDYVVFDEDLASSVGGTKGPWMTDEDQKSERREPSMTQVPEGHVWVAGDNLAYSRDSRYFGPLPMGLITGRIDYTVENMFNWKSFGGDNMVPVPVEEVE